MSADRAPVPDGAPEGHDAVCFTAGPKAAIVGAGAIHAYLSSRRKAPKVAAGISLGAANAAALQRVYKDLANADGKAPEIQDAARWAWFRRYLAAFVDAPEEVLWNAIPDQSDFFADMEPMLDPAVPEKLRSEEPATRRARYLKVKLGRWLAQLPVTVRLCSSALVHYVRMREKYPPAERLWSAVRLGANLLWLGWLLLWRTAISPQFFPERRFPTPRSIRRRQSRTPAWRRWLGVLGWLNLFSVSMLLILLVPVLALALFTKLPTTFGEAYRMYGATLGVLTLIVTLVMLTQRYREQVLEWKIVRAIWTPVIALASALYSIVNAVTLGIIAVLLVRALANRAVLDGNLTFQIALAFWFLFTAAFTASLGLKEVRSWLIDKGLIVEWPQAFSRPLFGWAPFIGAWANLATLAGSIVLAGLLFLEHSPSGEASYARHLVLSLALIVAVPVVPLLPFALTAVVWKPLRRLTRVQVGVQRVFAWLASIAVLVAVLLMALPLFYALLTFFREQLLHVENPSDVKWRLYVMSSLGLMLTWFAFAAVLTQPLLRRRFLERRLHHLGMKHGLIPDLYLQMVLARLFGREDPRGSSEQDPTVSGGEGYPAAVLVAAPLQILSDLGEPRPADQLYARPGTPLLYALRCALSVPPLLSPVRLADDERAYWLRPSALAKELELENDDRQHGRKKREAPPIDLVDGSVIRQNPLPALFTFLRHAPVAADMERMNDEQHPAIHVVYGVPIEGRQNGEAGPGDIHNTIVDVGLASLRLSQRRDTQLEVLQTNGIGRLAAVTSDLDGRSPTRALFVDEIAPEDDVTFDNHVSPGRLEVLDGVAAGCRRSLQTLYVHQLRKYDGPINADDTIPCDQFVRSLDRQAPADGPPGLPEVCSRCTGRLQRPPEERRGSRTTATVGKSLASAVAHCADHPQLTDEQPRVVFVASGGVFRGAFHIGLLASLKTLNVKPDLIVGASVGTLMGGALGALWCRPDVDMLSRLVELFLSVDDKVALTRTLKNASRELGIRGRSVRLSPRRVLKLVRRGGRGDAGFAATGAPSALIDAFSDLLLIPHKHTREIAAEFVAGHGTVAVKALIKQLRTETIERLGIETALLGTSLLEQQVVDLLTDGTLASRLSRQPFQKDGIAFYCTTTDLRTQSSLVLGGNSLHSNAPYDFVEAALSSSAFPAVFGPRAESLVFPGTGRADVLFADGGMFDNLPFLPAIEILARGQLGYRKMPGRKETASASLERRLSSPDLLIAGALDPRSETDPDARATFGSIGRLHRRAASLKHNVKIREIEFAARRVNNLLMRLHANPPDWMQSTEPTILDDIVNAGVLAVFPTSREHLNGTFSFCASTGLKRKRVQKSIADGCYQTLRTFAKHQADAAANHAELATDPIHLTTRAVDGLTKAGRIARVAAHWDANRGPRFCPFFKVDGARFECPFALDEYKDQPRSPLVRGVYRQCVGDSGRQRA